MLNWIEAHAKKKEKGKREEKTQQCWRKKQKKHNNAPSHKRKWESQNEIKIKYYFFHLPEAQD